MDQEQPTAAGSIEGRRQGCCAGLVWEAATLILNLPDQPIGRQDPTNAKLLGWIFVIAVADGIHKRLMQPQLNALTGEYTAHRLGEQLQ